MIGGQTGSALAQNLLATRRVPCTVSLSPTASTDTALALTCTGPVSFTFSPISSSLTFPANTGSATLFGFYATHVDADATATVTATRAD